MKINKFLLNGSAIKLVNESHRIFDVWIILENCDFVWQYTLYTLSFMNIFKKIIFV